MKKINLIFLAFISISLFGQVMEDFSDNNFTANPIWFGDTANFEVDNNQLHLNAPYQADTSCLVTSSGVLYNATWEFWIRLNFNPTDNNYARFYLCSDVKDIKGNVYGYYLKIGGSEDELSLYRQEGSNHVEIIDGTDDLIDTSNVKIRVKVTRDSLAKWRMNVDLTGGHNYSFIGSIVDSTYLQANYTGLYCKYTPSRSDQFYLDSLFVSGGVITDLTPPRIQDLQLVNDSTLMLEFNEGVDSSAMLAVNYDLSPMIGMPDSVVWDSALSVHILYFSQVLANNQYYTLYVSSVSDTNGNLMSVDSAKVLNFLFQPIGLKDVRVNEIMPDPNPVVGLPENEYIELYNYSSKVFDLKGWTISDGSTLAVLDHYYLLPKQYLLLCKEADAADFVNFQPLMALSGWPSLNNFGDSLILRDSSSVLVDSIHYSDNWYSDASKDDGGWSLSLIDPKDTCSATNLWQASLGPLGGTPGYQNSVFDTFYVRDISGVYQLMENDSATYSVLNSPGSIFEWAVSGGILLGGQYTNELTIKWPIPGPGTLALTETNSSGCIEEVIYKIIDVSPITGIDVNYVEDHFLIELDPKNFEKDEDICFEIFDVHGRKLYSFNGNGFVLNKIPFNIQSGSFCFIRLSTLNKTLIKKPILVIK